MRVFLSYARKDADLARQFAARLEADGRFNVWLADEEVAPGDNWAEKTGKALKESEWMVILLTPSAFRSDSLRSDIEYALASKKFEGRFFSVFVGPTLEAGKDMPWILLKLPHRQIESSREFNEVVKEIRALQNNESHANA